MNLNVTRFTGKLPVRFSLTDQHRARRLIRSVACKAAVEKAKELSEDGEDTVKLWTVRRAFKS